MISLCQGKMLDILPENIKGDPKVQAFCYATDRAFWRYCRCIGKAIVKANLAQQPEEVYDLLAAEWKVVGYRKDMSLSQKRELVMSGLATQMDKGTTGRVEKLMSEIFGDAELEEWFSYAGNPFMFRIVSSNPGLDNEDAAYFKSVLDSVKNLRSHLEEIVVRMGSQVSLYYASILHVGYYDTLG